MSPSCLVALTSSRSVAFRKLILVEKGRVADRHRNLPGHRFDEVEVRIVEPNVRRRLDVDDADGLSVEGELGGDETELRRARTRVHFRARKVSLAQQRIALNVIHQDRSMGGQHEPGNRTLDRDEVPNRAPVGRDLIPQPVRVQEQDVHMPGIQYLLRLRDDELERIRKRVCMINDSPVGRERQLQLTLAKPCGIVIAVGARPSVFAHLPPPASTPSPD